METTCDHAESLYGRCASCGMTWSEQAPEAVLFEVSAKHGHVDVFKTPEGLRIVGRRRPYTYEGKSKPLVINVRHCDCDARAEASPIPRRSCHCLAYVESHKHAYHEVPCWNRGHDDTARLLIADLAAELNRPVRKAPRVEPITLRPLGKLGPDVVTLDDGREAQRWCIGWYATTSGEYLRDDEVKRRIAS